MATVLRRRPVVAHDERLSLTDHLDELRSRIILCVLVLGVAFGVTFWQNHAILQIVNKPLVAAQSGKGGKGTKDPIEQANRFQRSLGALARAQERFATAVLRDPRSSPGLRAQALELMGAARAAAAEVPTNTARRPVTLGVTEPFTATINVALYAALLLAMPFLLFQAYAFVLPAFSPGERKVALPLMLMVPFLFVAGVLFGYFVVLPRAVSFLQNFNDGSFDILVQAKDYFRFTILFVAAIGLLFQIPVGVLGVTRLGIVTPQMLRKQRGPVLLGLAVVAAVATPTPDPVTMLLAMAPLYVLFEGSTWLAQYVNRASPPGSWWGEDEDLHYADEPDDHDPYD